MRLGVVDVGTNSCRLLVAEYQDGNIKELKRGLKITRLGEGVDQNSELKDAAIKRSLEAICHFIGEMKELNVENIKINGTSALRDVNNAEKLRKAVSEKTGFSLNIISGKEEARLNYIGVGYGNKEHIIIDIGGGSTEFIWRDDKRKINFKSLDMGSVRMTERFIKEPTGEVSVEEISEIEEEVEKLIKKKLDYKPGTIKKVIGLGGTITSIAAIDQDMVEYDNFRIQDYVLDLNRIKNIRDQLRQMNLEERQSVHGLQRERADIIIAGIEILYIIMDRLCFNNIIVSEHDLLYGALKEMIKVQNSKF